jgi:hypothetical protein
MNPKIEEYLNGELMGEELAGFEAKLAKDAQLRAEVAQMRPVLLQLRRANISLNVDRATSNYRTTRKVKRVVVLSCAIFFSVGVSWLIYRDNETSGKSYKLPKELPKNDVKPMPSVIEEPKTPIKEAENPRSNQYIKEEPIAKIPNKSTSPTPTSIPQIDNQLIAYAKELYKIPSEYEGLRGSSENIEFKEVKIALIESRFQDGLSILNTLDVMDVAEYSFLRAHLLYGKGDCKVAYQIFSALANNNKYPEWRDNAEWYQLLSGIASGQLPKANVKAMLNKIITDPNHAYNGKDALKLKEMLD